MLRSFFAEIKKLNPSEIGIQGTQVRDADAAIASFMNQVYVAAGIVAVIVIIISGYLYVTSNGDASRVAKAKSGIMYAVIGLIVVMLAFAITQMVIGSV